MNFSYMLRFDLLLITLALAKSDTKRIRRWTMKKLPILRFSFRLVAKALIIYNEWEKKKLNITHVNKAIFR